MGIRLSLKKELMGIDGRQLMTAEDVREGLTQAISQDAPGGKANFAIMSRFNQHHSLVSAGNKGCEARLVFERHRLFKEVLYSRESVILWIREQGGVI